MWRRWLDVAAARPDLLAGHAGAWAQLLAAEVPEAWRAWQRQALLWLAAVLTGAVALALAGVAVMLAALAPAELLAPLEARLALWLVPLGAVVLAGACARAAGRQGDGGAWARVSGQWQADRLLWQAREAP